MNYQNICRKARKVVEEAALFIKSEVGRVENDQIEDKAHNSLVSYVDKHAEDILVRGLGAIVPEATFLTEEDTIENKISELVWIIDPLDGTSNFLHQIPVFSVSVALQHHDEIVVGLVLEVNKNECFYAWKGGGAFLNEHPIHVSDVQTLSGALVATGYPSRNFDLLDPYFVALKKLMFSTRGMRRLGSAAVDLVYVACGRFSGYFEYGLSAWDVAAGIIIVKEAGGEVADFKGGNNYLFGGEMVASNGRIHKDFLAVLTPAFHA